MKTIHVIGIGVGNPEHVTVQAINALNKVDVFFFMDKGEAKEDLVRLRREICERYIEKKTYRIVEAADPVRDPAIEDYRERVEAWHQQRAVIYEQLILSELQQDQVGAFLVWGDPSLYDSTLRILDQVKARAQVDFAMNIVPGISSMQALAAAHKISLNGLGESVTITTGRRLAARLNPIEGTTLVMLDGQCAFKSRVGEDLEIHWTAYLGMQHEISIAGRLDEVAELIEQVRDECRSKHGWIMDIYVLSNDHASQP
jgi:precorrin-6A synthase